ncbi:MAG TPA: transglutaminase domain-containing protein [Nitrospirales bacterium]|nr:transglutaminase domain-containing protein [Nitrospirales bacterium]
MKAPPLLLGVTLVFWGWQNELLVLAVVAATLLEGSRWIGWRWVLTEKDFGRVWSLCIYLFVGMIGYFVLTTDMQGVTRAILTLFQWYPLSVLPIVLAQVYSTAGSVELSVLSTIARQRKRRGSGSSLGTIDLSFPYFAICLLSTSATHVKSPWFYAGLCLLVAWALLSIRPQVCSPLRWFVVVVIFGYGGQVGLQTIQKTLEGTLTDWLISMTGGHVDPDRSYTAIGSIGEIKLSNKIVLRMTSHAQDNASVLLRQASYNRYFGTQWFARNVDFRGVVAGVLGSGSRSEAMTTISTELEGGEGILALPPGAAHLQQLPVGTVQHNALGTVKVEDGPGLITYRVESTGDAMRDARPGDADLHIPEAEVAVLAQIVEKLGLTSETPRETLRRLAMYFNTNFQYSRFLRKHRLKNTHLSEFLNTSRSGHCEYFATATVLLLRAAGIPARYAVGLSVHEFSALEGRYIARARDAHSWALVYVDGAWRDFDTTPKSWVVVEESAAPWWEPLSDVWEWVTFKVAEWKWSERENDLTTYAGWLLLPLFLFLAWRLYFTERVTRGGVDEKRSLPRLVWPGEDSEWYEIEHRLNVFGIVRHPWEPFSRWLQRIRTTKTGSAFADSLDAILSLHYRYRFDPNGITKVERETLTSRVSIWLKQTPALKQRT